MDVRLTVDPLVAPWALGAAGLALAAVYGVYLWRGGRARLLRALAGAGLLAALANPQIVRETRTPTRDVAAVVIDASDSMGLEDRRARAEAIARTLRERLGADPTLEVRVAQAAGGPDGTRLFEGLDRALADTPDERVAGAIMITDGRAADAAEAAGRPYPVHALIVGDPTATDRRLEVVRAPRFAIVGQTAEIVVRAHGEGRGGSAALTLSVDGRAPQTYAVPLDEETAIQLPVVRRGPTAAALSLAPAQGELTTLNNDAVVAVSGVRERLRVLLITGEPHAGARAWRNLLKGDPAVDLVHFTILRPPEKQDFTPTDELSLIAFPVRELFVDRLADFDLVVFDRFRQLSILPDAYFDNIVAYVRGGGALLAAFGPEEAAGAGLYATPVGAVLPVTPTGRLVEEAFRPAVSAEGRAHPVTEGLGGEDAWGRWFRMVETRPAAGVVAMTGPGGAPLLALARAGEGRAAALTSDQVWLWARDYDGGGPFGELFRRTAHWLMKEPQLDDQRLTAAGADGRLRVERRTLGAPPGPVTIAGPQGERTLRLAPEGPGRFAGETAVLAPGVYRVRGDGLSTVAAVGARHPAEFAEPRATDAILARALRPGGGTARLADAAPEVRRVAAGGRAAGPGWIGLRRTGGFAVSDLRERPLAPAWAFLLVSLGALMAAWRREGR